MWRKGNPSVLLVGMQSGTKHFYFILQQPNNIRRAGIKIILILTLSNGHMMQCADESLLSCRLQTHMVLWINVTQINSTENK